MRFRTSSTPPMHLNPKLQRRMLGYVAVIAVALIVLQLMSSKPQAPNDPREPTPAGFAALDDRVRDGENRPLEPDEFRSFSDDPAQAGQLTESPPVVSRPPVPRNPHHIDPQILRPVEDNTLAIRRTESDAFFHVLDRARQFTPAQLERAAEPGVQYINLMQDPSLYRGKPVTIVGNLWKLFEFPASENDYGLKTLYEGWILTPDSGNRPIRIVCSRLGPGIAVDGERPTSVRITGYFFKREGYNSQSGQKVAPTILAGEIERYISPHAPPPADGLVPIVLGTVVAIGLILATTLVSFAWNDRSSRPKVKKLPPLSSETSEALAQLDYRSIGDQLRELEERDRFPEWYPQPDGGQDSHHSNGHAATADAAPPELPTPLPPTRPPRSQASDAS